MGRYAEPLETRFWRQVKKTETCWLWQGYIEPRSGYGQIQLSSPVRKKERPHRVAWMLLRGPIPEGMDIHHTCEVACCVNPDHMELLTGSDHLKKEHQKRRERGMYHKMKRVGSTSKEEKCQSS
jgi:hypothetical protein